MGDDPAGGPERILAYWHAVEMFEPQAVPGVRESAGRKAGERCVEEIRTGPEGAPAAALPWEAGHPRFGEEPAAGRYGSEWRHFVYGGLFRHASVRDAFADVLGYEPRPDYGGTRRDDDTGAMFAFAVDQRGRLIGGSASFSSCAWAVGRLYSPGPGKPGWLDGFERDAGNCERTLHRIVRGRDGTEDAEAAGTEPGPGGPADQENLSGPEQLPVRAADVRAFSQTMARDLTVPGEMAGHGRTRIVSVPVFRRRDGTLGDPEPVILSSLIAADLARVRAEAGDGFGAALASYLSGPLAPGDRTDLATDRAALLDGVRPARFPPGRWPADVSSPLTVGQQFAVNTVMRALGGEGNRSRGLLAVNGPPGTGKTTLLRDLIAAIIVRRAEVLATLEDPGKAFTRNGSGWRPVPALTGFEIVVASSSNAAVKNVTAELPGLNAIGEEWHGLADYLGEQAAAYLGPDAWGAIAAPLGKAENRLRFRDRYWFADGGMYQFLRARERDDSLVPAWGSAVRAFRTALDEASAMARKLDVLDSAARTPASPADVEDALSQVRSLRQALDHVPVRKARNRLQSKLEKAEKDARKARSALKSAEASVEKAERQAERIAAVFAAAPSSSDGTAWSAGWRSLSPEDQERAAPWADEEWLRARTRVFLAALDLHAAFAAGAAGPLLHNVGTLLTAMAHGPGPRRDAELRDLWQTLFLLLPVVSTTFASCGRMFGALGKESLGWLLIDEAGQALPQAAAGALWRSRRAVVIGDPMQLRPISQVPEEVQERLRGLIGNPPGEAVGAQWQPSGASAQELADRRSARGAAIMSGGPGGAAWVGMPLRVHRRCQEPMFSVSNAISYGGLMVYGTREQPFPGPGLPEYPRSGWIDVTGPSSGKWVPAQGDALLAVLRRLRGLGGVGLDRIYVLSPYRDVVFRCRDLVRRQLAGDGLPEDEIRDFTLGRVGTVHTTQGREADVVILVLGSDGSPAKRARDWAASPANLLNVAVSRARRRLFVIGDHADWGSAPHFSVLAGRLPRVRWPGQGPSAAGR